MLKRKLIYILIILTALPVTNGKAQADLRTREFYGRVSEKGKGIAGVPVTDGINIVITNEKGEYK